MATKIVKCKCDHAYQDQKYGKGKRVANHAPKQKGHRCSVCHTIHPDGSK